MSEWKAGEMPVWGAVLISVIFTSIGYFVGYIIWNGLPAIHRFSPTVLSLIAIGVSTVSIFLATLSIRRQGIPDRYEVRRRTNESILQTNPDFLINGFKIVFISVSEDGGVWNLIKKYLTGEIQGDISAFISIDGNDTFEEDFEGEYHFESSFNRPMPVTISAPGDERSERLIRIDTTNAEEAYGMLQWLLIDVFPDYVD